MKCLAIFLVGLFSIVKCTGEEEYTGARLLVSKQILNKYLVEDMDILLKVSIFKPEACVVPWVNCMGKNLIFKMPMMLKIPVN